MSDKKPQNYCAKVVAESGDNLLIEVPGPFPEGHRLVTAMVHKDKGTVFSMGLTIDRDYLSSFVDYQVRFGMLDRHPTDEEMDSLMRSLSTAMNESVTSIMAAFARMAVSSLGSDERSIEAARVDSATAGLLKMYKNITGHTADKETMANIRTDVEEYIANIDELPEDMSLMDVAKAHEDHLQEILDKYAPISEEERVALNLSDAFKGNGDLSAALSVYITHHASYMDTEQADNVVKKCVTSIFEERTASFGEMLAHLKKVMQHYGVPFDAQFFIDRT